VPFGVRSLGSLLGKGIQKAWLDPQLATHARFIDDHLATRPWFAGERLSMADIQMSFPVMALLARGGMHDLVHIEAWRQRWSSDRPGSGPSSAAAPSPYPAPEVSADPMTRINESNSLKNC
jgi:glutathione S-transferase